MSWAFVPIAAGYLALAWLINLFGFSLVGESRAGRRAVPVVALAWPLAIGFLVVVAIAAALDKMVDSGTAWMRGGDEL